MGFGIEGIWLFQIPKPNTKTQIPNDLRSYAGSESFPITAVFLSISHTLGLGNWVVISGICLLSAVLGSIVHSFPKAHLKSLIPTRLLPALTPTALALVALNASSSRQNPKADVTTHIPIGAGLLLQHERPIALKASPE